MFLRMQKMVPWTSRRGRLFHGKIAQGRGREELTTIHTTEDTNSSRKGEQDGGGNRWGGGKGGRDDTPIIDERRNQKKKNVLLGTGSANEVERVLL